MFNPNTRTTKTTCSTIGINIIKYTPATTIVDECRSDDTGVGLSIATGNQYWYKYRELLHITAKHKNSTIISLLINKKIRKIRSPHRLYIIADIAPLFAIGRIQYPMSIIDITPILSHPTNITNPKEHNIRTINLKNPNFKNLKFSWEISLLM